MKTSQYTYDKSNTVQAILRTVWAVYPNGLTHTQIVEETKIAKSTVTYYLKKFREIINTHDSTYAPLALFFLIDNKVVSSNCTSCMNCTSGCPSNALSYQFSNPLKEDYKLNQFLTKKSAYKHLNISKTFKNIRNANKSYYKSVI